MVLVFPLFRKQLILKCVLLLLVSTLNPSEAFGVRQFIPKASRNQAATSLLFRTMAKQRKSNVGLSRLVPFASASSSTGAMDETPKDDAQLTWKDRLLKVSNIASILCVIDCTVLPIVIAILFYVFHLQVLTQRALAFPFQLFPNNQGRFQSIGYDSLAGILSLCSYIWIRKSRNPPIPSLLSKPTKKNAPWRFPPRKKGSLRPGPKSTGVFAMVLLIQAYFFTGRFAIFWEDVFYAAAGVGFPLTIAMHRSLCVLFGHLTWVAIGALILRIVPRPQPFFGGGYAYPKEEEDDEKSDDGDNLVEEEYPVKVPLKYKWFTSRWDTNWLWWTIGGYFVSSWLFNIADFVNQVVLPPEILETAAEGVVSQLINPEHNDLAASVVGCIAPCVTAPYWEEILYRGFMLPAMCLQMSFWPAVLLSGLIFSAHHLSATGAIPLAVLGWTWATIYAKSGNLLVTILIHAMWNSRVFLGSWLGL